jgi:hypothetical protein
MKDGIDIVIDEMTPCLMERSSGKKYATVMEQVYPKKTSIKDGDSIGRIP